jgi:uncharacterized OsmC-like protein
MVKSRIDVRALQKPLRERYEREPTAAQHVLRVRSAASDLADPLHCAMTAEGSDAAIRSGAHPLVGGEGDVACSGDLLLAALAACQETTLRMVAANMGIDITSLDVTATAEWDARGTLAMAGAPIGLRNIRCHTAVVVAEDERGERAARLLRSAEKYCVILNTLREGVSVESTFELKSAAS